MSGAPGSGLESVLVLALDGATFHVIEPMLAEGDLPNLARFMAEGVFAPLPSTLPPVTFPAWSTFMTGLSPGEHGIFDFTQKEPGLYRLRFVNATHRRGEAIQSAVSRAGGRVLVLGLPATYPPEPLRGLLVPGFDAPVSTGTDARSTSDPALYDQVASIAGPWMRPELNESADDARFHERAVETLLARVERKQSFALTALETMRHGAGGARPDLAIIVFGESDTVGHHYWRDHDPASPRHRFPVSRARSDAIRSVYRALDRACGELRRAFGEDALCLVVSDHGMGGASRHVVHLNAYLAECGLLARSRRSGGVSTFARGARDLAVRLLPPSVAQQIFRRARAAAARVESTARFGGFDWSRSLAFSEEANTNPGVWINLAGREAAGAVAAEDYEATRDRVIEALLAWRLPTGAPVVARAMRREAVYHGPFVERAPDVVVELALEEGYGLSLVPTPWQEARAKNGSGIPSARRLGDDELAGGRGRGMNGTHRPNGIFIACGRDAETIGGRMPASLADIAPLIARGMGLAWEPERSEGGTAAPGRDIGEEYSEEEDAMVAARLKALGYLD